MNKLAFQTAGVATFLLAGVAGVYFLPSHDPLTPDAPTMEVIELDFSGSVGKDAWHRMFVMASDAATALVPDRDQIAVVGFDNDTRILRQTLPSDRDDFQDELDRALAQAQTDPHHVHGTRLALPFKFLADWLTNHPHERMQVQARIYTDGGNDDESPEMQRVYADAAKVICHDPRVKKLIVCGVRTGHFEELNRYFDPMGDRFVAVPDGDDQP